VCVCVCVCVHRLSLVLCSSNNGGTMGWCVERLWADTVSPANASASVPALVDFLAGRVLSAPQAERDQSLALGKSVCSCTPPPVYKNDKETN
jgi:hypothetical protein